MTNLEKVKGIFANANFAKSIEEMETLEELQAAIAAQGVELTAEEIQVIAEECVKQASREDDEINEEQMEQISGGFDPVTVGLAAFAVAQVAGLVQKKLKKSSKSSKSSKKSKKK